MSGGISAATIDILDASIPDEFQLLQSYPDAHRFKYYREEVMTDPVYWKRHQPPGWAFEMTWTEFRYADVSTAAQLDAVITSDLPGLYIFYIRPDRVFVSFPQLAMYVGISNERNSQRPLRERLKDYLPARIENKKKRENIDRMLRSYYGVLWVTYCLTNKPSSDLEALEETLHGFLDPRVGSRDYPVDIKTQQKAFG